MAIQVSGTSVINDSRQLQNIASLDSTTISTINSNISSGAITHLGTLNPTASATSLTLSSLNLTGYKQLYINFNFINMSGNEYFVLNVPSSVTNVNTWQQFAIGKLATGGGVSTYGSCWMVICDLLTGVSYTQTVQAFNYSYASGIYNVAGTYNQNYQGGNPNPNVTQSTTSIEIKCRSGRTFFVEDGNPTNSKREIDFYGVA